MKTGDPAIEVSSERVVRDEHVRLLMKENAELSTLVGQLQAQIEAGCGENI